MLCAMFHHSPSECRALRLGGMVTVTSCGCVRICLWNSMPASTSSCGQTRCDGMMHGQSETSPSYWAQFSGLRPHRIGASSPHLTR